MDPSRRCDRQPQKQHLPNQSPPQGGDQPLKTNCSASPLAICRGFDWRPQTISDGRRGHVDVGR